LKFRFVVSLAGSVGALARASRAAGSSPARLKQTVCHSLENHNSIRGHDCTARHVRQTPHFEEPKICEEDFAFPTGVEPACPSLAQPQELTAFSLLIAPGAVKRFSAHRETVLFASSGMILARFGDRESFKKGGRHDKF